MKKIKVLRIIARLNIGGPAIHTVLLTEGLDKNRFESLLVCGNVSKDEGDMLYFAKEKNVVPYFILELGRELNFWDDIVAFIKVYNVIRHEYPDIIHTHTAKAGALGRFAGIAYRFIHPFGKRIAFVHTFHGHVFHGYFNSFKTKFFIFIERMLAFFTTKIVTVSESVKDEILRLRICKAKKIEIISLGFELDKFLNIKECNSDIVNIGIVGRLVPIKNHRLFLDSTAEVIKNNSQLKVKCKIIGDGELRQELESYVDALGIRAQVYFLGWVKDLVGVYSDLDIVALTSINEGTPVSLIEAMASARAVVATDVGGVRDLLSQERGVVVKAGDLADFTKALILLIQDSQLRKKLGFNARNFVKVKFTKTRLIKDIENLYERICAP